MKSIARLVVTFAVAAATAAAAHEEGGRAAGTVESVSTTQLVLTAKDGHPVTFSITSTTVFLRGDKPTRREDVRIGQRAVVEGRRTGERLEAVRVKLGAAPPG